MLLIQHKETGETRELSGNGGAIPSGWFLVKGLPDGPPPNNKVREFELQLAMWATKFRLPVAGFLDAARWLLDKDCPFCQLGTQVLRRINELGEERAEKALREILAAKDANDLAKLEEIKAGLCFEQQA